jgi:transcription elongation factor GreA
MPASANKPSYQESMQMQKFPMTLEGEKALRDELQRLKSVDRPTVIQAIADAREHGDLKENAEYHAAREQQGFIEGRIQEIEGKLSNCQVIDIHSIPRTGKVLFGVTVTIINVDTDEEVKYKIVGDDEADIKANRISVSSPIARALIGKEEGDTVVVKIPSGTVEYEIDQVEHI